MISDISDNVQLSSCDDAIVIKFPVNEATGR